MLDVLKPLLPSYRIAQQKREFERYLRTQGRSRQEAKLAVAKKFGGANADKKPR